MPTTPQIEELFWKKVEKTDWCWEWTAARNSDGYGFYCLYGKLFRAHRLSWVFVHGPIPRGLCVLHKCDNPPCVNPGHLFLGTQKDNIRDCQMKGRKAKGNQTGKAILTEQQVINIRRLYNQGRLQREIANQYGVAQRTISHIITGTCWRHV